MVTFWTCILYMCGPHIRRGLIIYSLLANRPGGEKNITGVGPDLLTTMPVLRVADAADWADGGSAHFFSLSGTGAPPGTTTVLPLPLQPVARANVKEQICVRLVNNKHVRLHIALGCIVNNNNNNNNNNNDSDHKTPSFLHDER